MKKNFKLFCFGFGQVAKYFVKNLKKKDYKFDLVATNTTKTQLKEFNNLKYKSYHFIDNIFDKDLLNELNSSNKVLISIPPKDRKDIVLKVFNKNFKKNKFDWVTYLSATSIYGDKKGNWVDEKTIPNPTSDRGMARLIAENSWIKYYENFNLPIHIFRLSGIYSTENNVMHRLKMGAQKITKKNNHFFSRIHVEDIAEILAISLTRFNPGQIFNVSDDYPCPYNEVVKYAANLTKVNIPEEIKFKEVKNTKLNDFYKDSKKVSNKKMKSFFKYNLKYPTFKEGLEMIKNHNI